LKKEPRKGEARESFFAQGRESDGGEREKTVGGSRVSPSKKQWGNDLSAWALVGKKGSAEIKGKGNIPWDKGGGQISSTRRKKLCQGTIGGALPKKGWGGGGGDVR